MSHVQARFACKGDWGVRASEERLAESYDGCNGSDTHVSHESIIDHGFGRAPIRLPDLYPQRGMDICYRNYKGDNTQGSQQPHKNAPPLRTRIENEKPENSLRRGIGSEKCVVVPNEFRGIRSCLLGELVQTIG